MKLLCLDLELAQPSNRIIQIGAVIGDCDTGEIKSKLSIIVNPKEQLTDYIINLTGITQEMVDVGFTLKDAYEHLCDFKPKDCHRSILQWGKGDAECLKRQLVAEGVDVSGWPFGFREIDVKTIHQSFQLAQGKSMQGGLKTSMAKYSLPFVGKQHWATDDAENTFHLYHRLLQFIKQGTRPI